MRENFFSREKKPNVGFVILSPCPAIALATADLTLSRKAKKLFYLLLPTFVWNRAYTKNAAAKIDILQQRFFVISWYCPNFCESVFESMINAILLHI